MPKVKFTSALKRFFPDLKAIQVDGGSIVEVISQIEIAYPGIKSYILDDTGKVRKHVNIFIGDTLIGDDIALSDSIDENDEIHIFQALSGG